jgi:hypothetical protein
MWTAYRQGPASDSNHVICETRRSAKSVWWWPHCESSRMHILGSARYWVRHASTCYCQFLKCLLWDAALMGDLVIGCPTVPVRSWWVSALMGKTWFSSVSASPVEQSLRDSFILSRARSCFFLLSRHSKVRFGIIKISQLQYCALRRTQCWYCIIFELDFDNIQWGRILLSHSQSQRIMSLPVFQIS